MVKDEHKKKIVEQKLLEYEVKMYVIEIDKVALSAIGDMDGIAQLDMRLESLKLAHAAVKEMI